jgi:transcriptional regulator with XRE-family HTH domain
VRAALAEQHFGKIVRLYRSAFAPPINQADMAAWLGVGQSQVSRIENGRPPTDLAKLRRWAQVLRVPPELLWFHAPDAHDASPAEQPVRNLAPTASAGAEEAGADEGGEDDVRRRDVLKLAGAAAVGAPWRRLAEAVERRRAPDAALLGMVQDRTTEFFRLEETAPARTILDSLSEHGGALQQLLRSTSVEQDRRQLLSAAGETEALAGWMAFDLSRPREAQARYQRALRMADEAGDGPLTACALNYWSYLLASQDRSREAVELLDRAGERVRGSAPATQAWVAGRQAEEAARIGDVDTTERALARAFTAYDYARPHHERSWTSFFGPSRLGGLAVSAYGRIGHRETDGLANSLLDSLSPTETKVRALVIADLALSAGAAGEVDRAAELADRALPLAVRTEASLALDRLWELTEALPQDRGSAGELRQRVRSGLLGGDQPRVCSSTQDR